MNYKKIVSVVNEHTASTVIARYAIAIAASEDAELILYSAHSETTNTAKLLQTELHLDHLFITALELNIPVTRISEIGSLTNLLPKRVEAEQADLVFYPLPPDEKYGAALQQHDVHKLLRTIRTDLAIMRVVHMGKPHPQRILIPLGLSISDSSCRINFIAALANSFDSHATLLHMASGNMNKGMPDYISSFKRELKQHHIAVEERCISGHISKSIKVEAITRHSDLILLGASERSILRRLISGNPAGDVMHSPPCNTILFRAAIKTA